jgi:hypothetical protein
MAFNGRRIRRTRSDHREPAPSATYLLIAARVYTRRIRDLINEVGLVGWSAPKHLRRGDLALLYEMGKPDDPDDVPGRKEIRWLLRALTDATSDREWGSAADFEGFPLRRPLSLDDAKVECPAFASGPARSLQGRHRKLEPEVWTEIVRAIDRRNPGFDDALSSPAALDARFAEELDDLDSDSSDDADFQGPGRLWRSERFLQDDIADLIDEEGWAEQIDPGDLGLRAPSRQGYYLPAVNYFVDDLLKVAERHLLVVEYEMHAHGDPLHGAQQAADYLHELKKLRQVRGWTIHAVVIAEDFDQTELKVAERLNVECIRAGLNSDDELTLALEGSVRGPAWEARQSALVK